jgi:prepilin-type N-terminal cleavage/methylation domain-containing protein
MVTLNPSVPPSPTFGRGFTLVELAVVLVIVALLISGLMLPLSAQMDIRNVTETQKALNDARDALMGYVAVNGRLPCPDTDDDGAEDRPAGACTGQEGDLPYQTIGTAQTDGWGYRLRYRVSATFSNTIALTSVGDITVIARGDNPVTAGTIESKKENSLIAAAPAVILSVGKNGFGGLPASGGTRRPPPPGQDEILNNGGSKKVARTPTSGVAGCADNETEGTPLCEFDDQLVWFSTNSILNRLITTGKLP